MFAKPLAGRGRSASISAPTGGWNARDSVANMPPEDAVTLTNFFPATTDVQLRNGYTKHATGITGQVESLIHYSSGTDDELFAIAGGSVYDVTSSGAVGAAVVTGLTNSRFQYVNNTTSGGSYIQMVNGADKMQFYNGTVWAEDGDGAPYDVTGVNTANCTNIQLHANRVWLIEKDSLKAWYLGTNAIGGAANVLNLSSVATLGGYLVAMGSWTIDAGYGVDDLAAFVTSNGEVIVYKGSDPSSANTWALVGVWQLGAPVGARCFLKYAGDLLLICQDGIVPMSGALQSSRVNPRVAVTEKIQWAVSQAISLYGANFGWQLLYFAKENMLFLNVPVGEGSTQQQYVMNTISKSWCNFTGWNANCWELFLDDPYFGGNGFVGKAWDGLDDDGANINADGFQAFNYFKTPGILKRFTMLRPTLQCVGVPGVSAALNIDFNTTDTTATVSFAPTSSSKWGTAKWGTAKWSAGTIIYRIWQGANGIGYCAAPRIKAVGNGTSARWVATDIVFEPGAIL